MGTECKIRCTVALHGSWFTVEELAWLDSFLPKLRRLTTTSGMEGGKARRELYNEVQRTFAERFPYRNAQAHPDYEFTAEQKALTMGLSDQEKLREIGSCRIRRMNRMQGPRKGDVRASHAVHGQLQLQADLSIPRQPEWGT
ncbi:hypothetical protein FS749_010637 [Ceratobasidium sp. UAMH 11750]|nr:hypothetical protein FS749_010637 [Ceratobasidium sp. UAMH 11750]